MVASMGLPMGCNVVFFLDAEIGEMPQADGKAFWEVVNSISQEMLRQECSHYLAWYGKEGQKIMRKAVRCPEELSEFWGEILREPMGANLRGKHMPAGYPLTRIWRLPAMAGF